MAVVVVLHYNRTVFPLRTAIADHLFSWKRYSAYPCLYINVAFGFPTRLFKMLDVAAVVFQTSFLGMRWSRDLFTRRTAAVIDALKEYDCAKIAVPQDEFINTDLLDDFLMRVGATHILTCATETEWPKIYPRNHQRGTFLRTVLTGYFDEGTVERVSRKLPQAKRKIDIGYRAWRAHAWLGSWGRHKVKVAEMIEPAAKMRGLVCDISLDDAKTFHGDAWYDFLLDCKATIGVAGGASILDRDGSLRQRVEAYCKDHPQASFEEIKQACFAAEDGSLNLACISPRHLEACLTKTAQILIEGSYSGILEAHRHYFPLKPDYSNIEDALDFVSNDQAVADMTDRAYHQIVASGTFTYHSFIAAFDRDVSAFRSCSGAHSASALSKASILILKIREILEWALIKIEVEALKDMSNDIRSWKSMILSCIYKIKKR